MRPQQKIIREEPSLGDLFSELAAETGSLVRQEVALAQAEITGKAVAVGRNIGYLVIGGAIGYAAMLVILAAVVMVLAYVMPMWLAALMVGAAVAAVSYFLVTSALAELKKADLAPRESVESIKEDAQWLKDRVT